MAKRALCRYSPEVGAGCLNRACPELCGGRRVTGVPTANVIVSPTVSPGASGVGKTSTAGALIAPPRFPQALATSRMGAVMAAIALAPVTAATNRYLRAATPAQKEAARIHRRRSSRSAAGFAVAGNRSTGRTANAILQALRPVIQGRHSCWLGLASRSAHTCRGARYRADLPVEIGVAPVSAAFQPSTTQAIAGHFRSRPRGSCRRAPHSLQQIRQHH